MDPNGIIEIVYPNNNNNNNNNNNIKKKTHIKAKGGNRKEGDGEGV